MNKHELDEMLAENPFLVLSDVIYQSLYNDIIQLKMPPDSRLNESKIAEELGISRSPVKSALSKLEKDGLVYKKSGKILAVSWMTKEDGYSLYEARSALEGFAASLAVIRITAEQMKELEELTRQYVAVCNGSNKELNPNDYADIDHKFHSLIVTASCNPYIMRMYRSLEGYLLHYRYCLYYSLGPEKPAADTLSGRKASPGYFQCLPDGLYRYRPARGGGGCPQHAQCLQPMGIDGIRPMTKNAEKM
ncbi:MAG: GntR family transcriptional regulator [[Clostridium] scindens]